MAVLLQMAGARTDTRFCWQNGVKSGSVFLGAGIENFHFYRKNPPRAGLGAGSMLLFTAGAMHVQKRSGYQ